MTVIADGAADRQPSRAPAEPRHPPACAGAAVSLAIPRAHGGRGRGAGGRGGLRAGARPGPETRHRRRLLGERRRVARHGALCAARYRLRARRRDLHALLFGVVDRRARLGRHPPRGVRASAGAVSRILRDHTHGRGDFAAHQRYGALGAGHRLFGLVRAAQHAYHAWSLVMLVITSPKLTALVVLGAPLVIAPILLFGRRVRKLSRASQDRIADVSTHIDESLHEIRTVQSYGHEEKDRERFGERVEQAFGTAVRRIGQRALLVALVMLLAFGAVGVILWIGGHDVLAGRISAGELSAFVFYAVLVAGAVGAVSEVIGDLQRAAGATERLMELLATEP